jgi:hypothetical protein
MRLIIFLWQHEHDFMTESNCQQIFAVRSHYSYQQNSLSAATTSHDLNRMTGVIWCDLDMETDMLDQF